MTRTERANAYAAMTTAEYPKLICRGGRTGQKLHASQPGSSVTNCGIWMKANAQHYKVPTPLDPRAENRICEKCFPPRPE